MPDEEVRGGLSDLEVAACAAATRDDAEFLAVCPRPPILPPTRIGPAPSRCHAPSRSCSSSSTSSAPAPGMSKQELVDEIGSELGVESHHGVIVQGSAPASAALRRARIAAISLSASAAEG